MEESAKNILVIDTETSGMPDWKSPSEGENQPHIVEICGHLYSPKGVLLEKYCSIVKPSGWAIDPETIKIHGITQEQAEAEGVDEREAVLAILSLQEQAGLRVGHCKTFDDRIMRIGIKRFVDDDAAEKYRHFPGVSTEQLTKSICKLPPTEKMKESPRFRNSFKTPTLVEAFDCIIGADKRPAQVHRAEADVIMCARIYFAQAGIAMPDYPDDIKPSEE